MGEPEHNGRPQDETAGDRLRGIVASDAMSVDLVSAFSGDRPLTGTEKSYIETRREARGELFYSDLLYAVTHQHFSPSTAEQLWKDVLRHKVEMSEALKRNVQIVVATLDYLTNIEGHPALVTLIDEKYIARIVDMSMRDGLTGLFNHASCRELIDLELRRYVRHGVVVSLVFMDIDDFKEINDECGHQEGDRILKELSSALECTARDSDICCRYGGEEFVVILPLTNARAAAVVAERVRIAAMRIPAGSRTLTLSLGVASCDEDTISTRALIERADRALYQAKQDGKNRVATG